MIFSHELNRIVIVISSAKLVCFTYLMNIRKIRGQCRTGNVQLHHIPGLVQQDRPAAVIAPASLPFPNILILARCSDDVFSLVAALKIFHVNIGILV